MSASRFIINEIAMELGVTPAEYEAAHRKVARKYGVNIDTIVRNPVPSHAIGNPEQWSLDRMLQIKQNDPEVIDVSASRMEREFWNERREQEFAEAVRIGTHNFAGNVLADEIEEGAEREARASDNVEISISFEDLANSLVRPEL